MENQLVVQDIYVYPVKSLGGIRLSEAVVEERGFRYDRRWMLVDEAGVFITQRKYPELALLRVALGEKGLRVTNQKNGESVEIPFGMDSGEELTVTVWHDLMLAKTVDANLDSWFSDFLGFSVRLVRMPEATQRKIDPRYAVNAESVSFADGMPYLIIGQASLDELNSRLESPVPMNRFRPNIVIAGGSPFLEDSLRKIKIGELVFAIVKPCARCVMTTVDQATGEKGKEPLRTLSTYRAINGKIYFGQNVVALQSGKIKVGDQVQPL